MIHIFISQSLNIKKTANEAAKRKAAEFPQIQRNNHNKYQSDGKQNGKWMANQWQTGGKWVATLKDCNIDKIDKIERIYITSTQKNH